jgi:hypothetical protein
MLYSDNHRNVFFSIAVSFFIFLFSPFISYSQTETDAVFILKGNTRSLATGKGIEGVELELKKNGESIQKILSGKNGKYSLKMDISILNKSKEYVLYITQAGTVPKSISINTYISPDEYNSRTFPSYVFELEIKMIETTEKDIIIEKPSGRIIWDNAQHAFAFDQTYAKLTQKTEDNPDKFLADKKKKEEEEIARKKAEEDAAVRAKAETDAKAIAEKKSKEDADGIVQKNLAAMKAEMRRKRVQDSLDSIAGIIPVKASVEIKKKSLPVSADDVDENAFDGNAAYSINIAHRSLKMAKEKMNKEKAANLSAKYETNNTLTSLLNMVDEDDKNQKLKVKQKQ